MMEDYAAFCRQRLRACFHRRRKYPVGSDDRAHAVKEARAFLRYYRREMQIRDEERNQSLATTPQLLRCVACGSIHYAAAEDEKALDRCFKCDGLAFEVAAPDAAPRGVTLLPIRWPPLSS